MSKPPSHDPRPLQRIAGPRPPLPASCDGFRQLLPNAVPPVCRLLDFGKFMYEKTKRERDYIDAIARFFDDWKGVEVP